MIIWWSVLPLGATKKKSTKIGPPYICQRTKESFNSSIKGNLQVFQNHAKQAKIKVVFPLLGLNEPIVVDDRRSFWRSFYSLIWLNVFQGHYMPYVYTLRIISTKFSCYNEKASLVFLVNTKIFSWKGIILKCWQHLRSLKRSRFLRSRSLNFAIAIFLRSLDQMMIADRDIGREKTIS